MKRKKTKFHSIAIDGPSGAGKSTIARMAASKFGYIYVDTGALYRCIGLFAYENGTNPQDEEQVTSLLDRINIEMCYDDDGIQKMILNKKDVSKEIRMPEISIYASKVSAIPAVRSFLLDTQRNMALKHNVIMDGRDIGTVVLPDSELKIFLTASPEARAQRRYEKKKKKGIDTTFDEVLSDINIRDENDTKRAAAPLRPAEDAVIIDTSGNTLEQSVDRICTLIAERFGYEKGL